MSIGRDLPVEARIMEVLKHLGIAHAHFAGRAELDWQGVAEEHPGVLASLTLVGSSGIAPEVLKGLTAPVLVLNGTDGALAQNVAKAASQVDTVEYVELAGYETAIWSDPSIDHFEEVVDAMVRLSSIDGGPGPLPPGLAAKGEIAGATYAVSGAGPPLVLLPLGLSPSQ